MQMGTGRSVARMRRRMRRFHRDDDGSLVVFGLFIILLMILAGGIAVDVMRSETQRTRLQNTADGAALAAASLTQLQDPIEVVEDYFLKAGLRQELRNILPEEGLNFRNVRVEAAAPLSTFFMRMVGVSTLVAPATSAAEERIPNIEVSLVLDISGSMRFTDQDGMMQITRLRPAANNFINRMLAGDRADKTSISIVPYAGAVNPGAEVFNLIGGQRAMINLPMPDGSVAPALRDHPASSCVNLTAAHFDSTSVPQFTTFQQVPHFMYWAIDTGTMDWGWCPLQGNSAAGEPSQSIEYLSANAEHLTGYIDRMRLHDGTGTHYGMLWGLWLLDPDSNWLVQELVDQNVVHDDFMDRPAPWDDPETLKVIVLMTDGNITQQVRPRFPDRTLAPLAETDTQRVYLNHTRELQRMNRNDDCNGQTCHVSESNQSTNVARFYAACDAAKANGVVIFTIAFNTNASGRAEMQNCATSVAHYYDVRGADLDSAFQSIAGAIQMLRLTE